MMETAQLTKSDLLKGIENIVYSKKLARNTVLFRLQDGTECVKYHDTIVVKKSPDGKVTFNSGGFRTITTKKRFWEFGRLSVSQMAGVWYMPDGSLFYDGIVMAEKEKGDYTGHVEILSERRLPDPKEDKHIKTMKDKIKKYVNRITPTNMPQPGPGDCWYCGMKEVKTNKPLGDIAKDTSHLISHLKEGYVVGSLLVNAMREEGFGDDQIGMSYAMPGLRVHLVQKAVSRYLTRRLLPQIAPR